MDSSRVILFAASQRRVNRNQAKSLLRPTPTRSKKKGQKGCRKENIENKNEKS